MKPNTAQIASFVRWICNAISGGIIAYTAARSPAAQSVGAFLSGLINAPDAVAGGVLLFNWIWGHVTHSDSPPSNPPLGSALQKSASILAVIGALCVISGCAHLSPNADPIVVRAEQTLTGATATFDTFLTLENQNRELVKNNLPKVHDFAEWLRVQVPFSQDNPQLVGRWSQIVESAELAKIAYKKNRTTDNETAMFAAVATLQSSLDQTENFLAQLKTLKP